MHNLSTGQVVRRRVSALDVIVWWLELRLGKAIPSESLKIGHLVAVLSGALHQEDNIVLRLVYPVSIYWDYVLFRMAHVWRKIYKNVELAWSLR